jgi:hypothetical protein
MKFVLAFTPRGGGSEVEQFEASKRAQMLLSKWQPSPAATMREWVQRCDGNGGFAVLETDSPTDLLKDITTWSSFLDFNVYPVVDIGEATAAQAEGLAAREAVS